MEAAAVNVWPPFVDDLNRLCRATTMLRPLGDAAISSSPFPPMNSRVSGGSWKGNAGAELPLLTLARGEPGLEVALPAVLVREVVFFEAGALELDDCGVARRRSS